MPVLSSELIELINTSVVKAFEKKGITLNYLAGKAKEELESTVKKTLKIKGAVEKLPDGYSKIVSSGLVMQNKDGEFFGTGDSVITWDEINHTIRQKAVERVHKLRGDFPSEKHEIGFSEEMLSGIINSLPEEYRKSVCDALIDIVSKKDD